MDAPEQALGERVSSAADVFAWGATVAFAATGRPPFERDAPRRPLPGRARGARPRRHLAAARRARRPHPRERPRGASGSRAAARRGGARRHGRAAAAGRYRGDAAVALEAPGGMARPRSCAGGLLDGDPPPAAPAAALGGGGGTCCWRPSAGSLRAQRETRHSKVAAPGAARRRAEPRRRPRRRPVPPGRPRPWTSASLPVVTCPTANGIGVARPSRHRPRRPERPRALVSQLAVFADDQG